MVKDLKYIIKRVLIGVGIALILMMIKDKSFILSANAKSYKANPTAILVKPLSGSSQYLTLSTWQELGAALRFYGYYNTGVTQNINEELFRFTFNDDDFKAIPNGMYTVNTTLSVRLANSDVYSPYTVFLAYRDQPDNTFNCVDNGPVAGKTKPYVNITCENVDIDSSRNLYLYVLTSNQTLTFQVFGITAMSFTPNQTSEVKQAIEQTNNTIKDDSIDEEGTSSSISSLNDKNASNGSITQLLTLPITLFQSVLNSVSGSCSSFNLGNLLGTNLTMPCIDLENILGSTLYGIIDILLCGLFILVFRKKMVDIFNHMTSLNDRGNELE